MKNHPPLRRLAATLLVLTLLLSSVLLPASAESSLRPLYDAAYDLFLDTSNVTLTGQAEFFLDGERFKTATSTYQQDGARSCWQLQLLTPREGQEDRESGFTIIADGEYVFVMEAVYPGLYKDGTMNEQTTVFRKSLQQAALTDLIRLLVDQADTLLPEGSVSVLQEDASGTEVRVQLDDSVPEIIDTALNLVIQYAARRYFVTDYDQLDDQMTYSMENFPTVTQGILYATRYYALDAADVTMKLDADGELSQVTGSLAVRLNTGADGTRLLETSFQLNVSDREATRVAPFDPEAYHVTMRDGSYDALSLMAYSDPEPDQEMTEKEKQLWRLAGYDPDQFEAPDGYSCWFDDQGTLLELQDIDAPWLNMHVDGTPIVWADDGTPADPALVDMITEFLKVADPSRLEGYEYRVVWEVSYGEERFTEIDGFPQDNSEDLLTFVFKVAPDLRIQYYTSISNG